jgi:hypothetical protein
MVYNVKTKSVHVPYDVATNKFTYPAHCKKAFVLYEKDTLRIFAYVVPGYPIYCSERYAKTLVTQHNQGYNGDRQIAYAELQYYADHISQEIMADWVAKCGLGRTRDTDGHTLFGHVTVKQTLEELAQEKAEKEQRKAAKAAKKAKAAGKIAAKKSQWLPGGILNFH